MGQNGTRLHPEAGSNRRWRAVAMNLPTENEPAVLVHGDCLDVMQKLPNASIDAVVTDPPYFLPAVHYNTRTEFPRSMADLSMLEHFYRDWFAECARVVKSTGCLYVFCDDQSYPVFYALNYRHARRQRSLVWDKEISFTGFSWRNQHDQILFAEMDEYPAVKTGDGDILRCRSVPVDNRDHPAEKPPALLRRLVEKSVEPNGFVLDPFAGSASTGVACLAAGRRFLGIEQDAAYVAIGRERLNKANGHGGLFSPKATADLFAEAL